MFSHQNEALPEITTKLTTVTSSAKISHLNTLADILIEKAEANPHVKAKPVLLPPNVIFEIRDDLSQNPQDRHYCYNGAGFFERSRDLVKISSYEKIEFETMNTVVRDLYSNHDVVTTWYDENRQLIKTKHENTSNPGDSRSFGPDFTPIETTWSTVPYRRYNPISAQIKTYTGTQLTEEILQIQRTAEVEAELAVEAARTLSSSCRM